MSEHGSPPPPPAPDIAGASNPTPTPWYRRWWAITGFVVLGLVVLLIVLLAVLLVGGSSDEPSAAPPPSPSATPVATSSEETGSPTEATQDEEPETPAGTTAATEVPATSATSTATDAPATDEPGGDPGSRDDPLSVGDTGTLSEWDVTVDEINLDATREMLDANQFNDEPTNGNYGLVTLTATYTGEEEGDAGFMLGTTLSGADRRQYADTDCLATEPNSMFDQPTVENGGTVTGQFCLDFPDAALGDGAVLFVEETFSFTDERVFWGLPTS